MDGYIYLGTRAREERVQSSAMHRSSSPIFAHLCFCGRATIWKSVALHLSHNTTMSHTWQCYFHSSVTLIIDHRYPIIIGPNCWNIYSQSQCKVRLNGPLSPCLLVLPCVCHCRSSGPFRSFRLASGPRSIGASALREGGSY